MELALADAQLSPADVSHINAHGTSTPLNDLAEAIAVREVFGDDAPPTTSIKGHLGHSLAAAGALEGVASVVTLLNQTIPPTAGTTDVDPQIGLDVVIGEPRPADDRRRALELLWLWWSQRQRGLSSVSRLARGSTRRGGAQRRRCRTPSVALAMNSPSSTGSFRPPTSRPRRARRRPNRVVLHDVDHVGGRQTARGDDRRADLLRRGRAPGSPSSE